MRVEYSRSSHVWSAAIFCVSLTRFPYVRPIVTRTSCWYMTFSYKTICRGDASALNGSYTYRIYSIQNDNATNRPYTARSLLIRSSQQVEQVHRSIIYFYLWRRTSYGGLYGHFLPVNPQNTLGTSRNIKIDKIYNQ